MASPAPDIEPWSEFKGIWIVKKDEAANFVCLRMFSYHALRLLDKNANKHQKSS